MAAILSFLNDFVTIIVNLFKFALDGFLYLFILQFKIILMGLFGIVLAIISAIDVGSFLVSISAAWGFLDPKVAYLINQTGFPTGMSILAWSYGIRFLLNLIPAAFTRV